MLSNVTSTAPRSQWWLLMLRGLLALGYGVLAFAFPGATAVELMAFVATYIVADGAMTLLSALRLRPHADRWWLLLVQGVFSLAFAPLAFPPSPSLAYIVIVVSLWWLLGSVAQFIVTKGQQTIRGSSGWSVVEGILSVALAVTAVVWPLTMATTVALFAWLGLLVGVGRVVVAIEVKSLVGIESV